MNVRQTIRFPFQAPEADHEARVPRAAERVEPAPFLGRKPAALSGGRRQRIALARAFVRMPEAVLKPAPLPDLGAGPRVSARAQIESLSRELRTATTDVAHDRVGAMPPADRLVEAGILRQVGTPAEICEDPAGTLVAGLIGSPAMTQIAGETASGAFHFQGSEIPGFDGPKGPVCRGFRAEDAAVAKGGAGGVRAPVRSMGPPGGSTTVTVRAGGGTVSVEASGDDRTRIMAPFGAHLPRRVCQLRDPAGGERLA